MAVAEVLEVEIKTKGFGTARATRSELTSDQRADDVGATGSGYEERTTIRRSSL